MNDTIWGESSWRSTVCFPYLWDYFYPFQIHMENNFTSTLYSLRKIIIPMFVGNLGWYDTLKLFPKCHFMITGSLVWENLPRLFLCWLSMLLWLCNIALWYESTSVEFYQGICYRLEQVEELHWFSSFREQDIN